MTLVTMVLLFGVVALGWMAARKWFDRRPKTPVRKPLMRPKTAAEIDACRSCDGGCWFGCEIPVTRRPR